MAPHWWDTWIIRLTFLRIHLLHKIQLITVRILNDDRLPAPCQPQGYVTGALGAKFASVSRTYKASTSTSENSIPQGDVWA